LRRWAELTGRDPAVVRQVADAAEAYARTGVAQPVPANVDLPQHATAKMYVLLGRTEQALALLVRASEQRNPGVMMNIADPDFDVLRREPRFIALLEKAGLPR
jgi:predicted Zn-dependent protease